MTNIVAEWSTDEQQHYYRVPLHEMVLTPMMMSGIYALVSTATMALVMPGLGWPSPIALCLNYFCLLIMFPVIFALGLKDPGDMTWKSSSVPVMTILGGAICPIAMGRKANVSGMAFGFVVPMICFAFIAWYPFCRAKSDINLLNYQHSHV